MKRRAIIFLLMAAVMLTAHAVFGDSHGMARDLVAEGAILPLEEVLERVRETRPGQVLEVELEKKRGQLVYEIELLNPSGEVWEVKVDAASGEILNSELED